MKWRAVLCRDLGNGMWDPYEPIEFEAGDHADAKQRVSEMTFEPQYIGLLLDLPTGGQQIISVVDGRVAQGDNP